MHLFAIAISLSNAPSEKGAAAAVSALGFDKRRLHAPARPGDELSLRGVVVEARPSEGRPELGVVRWQAEIINQRDEVISSFESAFLLQRLP